MKVNYECFRRFQSNPEQTTSLKSVNSCPVSEKRADTAYGSWQIWLSPEFKDSELDFILLLASENQDSKTAKHKKIKSQEKQNSRITKPKKNKI